MNSNQATSTIDGFVAFSKTYFALNRYTLGEKKKELHELRVSGCQINVQYRSVFTYENQDTFNMHACIHYKFVCVYAK